MSEFFQERLDSERAKRKAETEKTQQARELSRATRDAARSYANPKRKEEAVQRFKELNSPARATGKSSPPASTPSGGGVDFYVWQEGVVGKMKILTEGEFTPSE